MLLSFHGHFFVPPASPSVSLHGFYKQGHEALLAQVKGSLKNTQSLQLAVSGDLRHTIANLAILPPVLGLDGVLGQSDMFTEGNENIHNHMMTYLFVLNLKEPLRTGGGAYLMLL